MKKIAIGAVTVAVLVVAVIGFFAIRERTLSVRFDSKDIFIPKGMCNEYKSEALREEITVWKYILNDKEREEIEKQLGNSPWVSADSYEFGFYLPDGYYPDGLSENLYYCIYDFEEDAFDNFNRNFPIIFESRMLFLYDADAGNYYCFLACL